VIDAHNSQHPTAIRAMCARCRSTYESFRHGGMVNPGGACLGWRPVDSAGIAGPYVWVTYAEALARVDALHAAFAARGALASNEDGMPLLAIYMKNCPEWVLAEQACFAGRGATVPLYDTLGPATVEFVLKQTGCATVVCGGATEALRVLSVAAQCPRLKLVVVVDPRADCGAISCEAAGAVEVVAFGVLEGEGLTVAAPPKHVPPQPHDIATFCYTSGGNPRCPLAPTLPRAHGVDRRRGFSSPRARCVALLQRRDDGRPEGRADQPRQPDRGSGQPGSGRV